MAGVTGDALYSFEGGARLPSRSAMKCPICRTDNDRVIDSRTAQHGYVIRRRRECLKCHRRYTTYERIEEPQVKIIKKDGSRVPFERNKIKTGIAKACWKRPISDEQIEQIVAAVESEIYQRNEPEVESREVGELVMKQLRLLDQVAFVRFASIYREFKDIRDFVDELQPMLSEKRKVR